MILPQEIPRHRQEREQRSITHKGKKTYDARELKETPSKHAVIQGKKERKKNQSRTHAQ
jgi:hypothetical protein